MPGNPGEHGFVSHLEVRTPAKINLHLRVGGPRSDGYHPIRSWFASVSLFDSLSFELTDRAFAGGLIHRIELTCDEPALPCGSDNLVVKATQLGLEALDREKRAGSVRIGLSKRIPIGGGLGGGSSDAAACLKAIAQAIAPQTPIQQLTELAGRLGSDVAFFLHAPTAVASGRGECLEPAVRPACGFGVLMLPGFPVATPAVYKLLDQIRPSPPSTHLDDDFDPFAWGKLSAKDLLPRLVNDLEAPAFVLEPRLDRLRQSLEAEIEQPVRMSGSGSTLFTLCDTLEAAQEVARRIAGRREIDVRVVTIGNDRIEVSAGSNPTPTQLR